MRKNIFFYIAVFIFGVFFSLNLKAEILNLSCTEGMTAKNSTWDNSPGINSDNGIYASTTLQYFNLNYIAMIFLNCNEGTKRAD